MRYYCGIDGGGTKTAVLLTDEAGHELASSQTTGSSWIALGEKGVADLYKAEIDKCLKQAGGQRSELAGIAAGVPCFGENLQADETIKTLMKERFEAVPVYLCNDAEVGWAGSLGLKPGINIVAGTGSIAYGQNSRGESVRCGGWSTHFGDEGSCYWLGRKAVELFAKEMDGRAEKGALYEIIMDEFKPERPEDFVNMAEIEYSHDRSRVASLQKYLLMAAKAGDDSARSLYLAAADELGLMALAAARRIQIPGEQLGVSVSGGILHAREFFFERFNEWIERFGGYYKEAEMTPVQGAALLARHKYGDRRRN